ncbi:hypothetical protein COV93_00420 [Candidatus Woesearchaeota archaeon CG11_big_fil_rev_8_21_14_0_20_43_8]|nr:MAG: hypothetical protein COV93_00420 [Candidatus Woesearchaeota archaeon CG11_big_fil_rev_8_21_14_0_20_43_8]PIO06921.1 MAG: hypothetical protein COT47_02270 [Candidatus Woesearchaeota archaeon CG08_land_8_20_14_0_20_43_7]
MGCSFKRGNVGLGLLIALIAFMIVSAIAGGAIMLSTGTLRTAAFINLKDSRDKMTNYAQVLLVEAEDGREDTLNRFEIHVRMPPQSNTINLNKTLIIFKNRNASAFLTFNPAYESANCSVRGPNGYMTFRTENYGSAIVWNDTIVKTGLPSTTISANFATSDLTSDLDGDGTIDRVFVCCGALCSDVDDSTQSFIRFNLSSVGSAYVPLLQPDGSPVTDLCSSAGLSIGNNMTPIRVGDTTYGYFSATTTTAAIATVDAGGGGTGLAYVYMPVSVLDLNRDGQNDYLYLNLTHVAVRLSDGRTGDIPLNGYADWTDPTTAINVDQDLSIGGEYMGHITMAGVVATNDVFPANGIFRFTPTKEYRGWYAVEPLVEGADYQTNHLSAGDVIKFCFESPAPIEPSDSINIGFVSSTQEYYVSLGIDVFPFESMKRVGLYP